MVMAKSKGIEYPTITITYAAASSSVVCSCGFDKTYRSSMGDTKAAPAAPKAMAAAKRHGRMMHPGKFVLIEKRGAHGT